MAISNFPPPKARAFHGSWGHERQDAATFARWGCDYLKEDSCGGPYNGTLWEAYSLMRDALNATGRSIYFSITQQFGRCVRQLPAQFPPF